MSGTNASTPSDTQQQQVQVNPIDCARFALTFMARADFKAHERAMYDVAEGLLKAIVEGKVQLAPPPQQEEPPPNLRAVPIDKGARGA